ncbi:MAG: hypothetical protein WCE93_00305 [Nitrososphaeraceae archaeon]
MVSSPTYVMTITVILLLVNILMITIIIAPTLVRAQMQSAGTNNSSISHKMGVKIMSPIANTTVPAGQLTINGISSDTPKTNCKVFVDWNDVKPMQNVTANGPGGINDYSNWTFVYTEKYHSITSGINELTSKITCFDNPSNITSKFYSVNVTGK